MLKKLIKSSILLVIICTFIVNNCTSVHAGLYKKGLDDLISIDYDNIVEYHVGPDTDSIPAITEAVYYHDMPYMIRFSVDESNEVFSTYKGCLYNKEQSMLISVPQGLRYVEIPSTCVNLLAGSTYGTSNYVRKQIKTAISKNNGGRWPGYTRLFNYIY